MKSEREKGIGEGVGNFFLEKKVSKPSKKTGKVFALGVFVLSAIFFSFFIGAVFQSQTVAVSSTFTIGEKVFVGGSPLGISVKSDGVLVVEKLSIETEFGEIMPKSSLEVGDVITEIEGERVLFVSCIEKAMQEFSNTERHDAQVTVIRGGRLKSVTAYPIKEGFTGEFKLGINAKENAEGIGTLTFVKQCGRFSALGHPINSIDGSRIIPMLGGSISSCDIVGATKGRKGEPGELKGVFTKTTEHLGTVETNSKFGISGQWKNTHNLSDNEVVELASISEVKKGKAQIVSTVGEKTEKYDIEITKASSQNSPQEKGLSIKVTDKRLLQKTGGIVQGMSGSPILQNGKLVGAVTHVLSVDPTRGYGVYAQWL